MADKFTALAELFVLGTLGDEDAQQFAQHLATGCPECGRTVKEAMRVVRSLSYTTKQNKPPPILKQRLLDEVAAEAKTVGSEPASIRAMPSRAFYQRVRGTLAWAAVFLLVAMTYGYFVQRSVIKQLRQQVSSLEQHIVDSRASIKLLEHELAQQRPIIERIRKSAAPKLLLVELKGLPIHPSGRAKILLDPTTAGGSFVAYNLPPLTSEQDYQLWFIKGGKPFDAGVFHVDEKGEYVGEVRHLPETLAGITAFAVTMEPKGGRPEPTLDQMYLMGAVQGG